MEKIFTREFLEALEGHHERKKSPKQNKQSINHIFAYFRKADIGASILHDLTFASQLKTDAPF